MVLAGAESKLDVEIVDSESKTPFWKLLEHRKFLIVFISQALLSGIGLFSYYSLTLLGGTGCV